MKYEQLKEIQKRLEKEMFDGGVSRWHGRQESAIKKGEASATDWNSRLMKQFIEPVADGLSAVMANYEGKKGRFPRALAFLGCIDMHEAAFITVRSMLNALALHDATSLQTISEDIASKIEDQVRFSKLSEDGDKRTQRFLEKVNETLRKSHSASYRHKRAVYSHAERKLGSDWQEWDRTSKVDLGSLLIKVACECIVVWNKETEALDPLFYLSNVKLGKGADKKTSKVLSLTTAYLDYVTNFVERTEAMYPEVGPCVVPPRSWKSAFSGGFHTAKIAARNPLIKISDKELMERMSVSQMPMVYKAVNALQRTQWRVNADVLDVLQEICEKKIPLAVPDFDAKNKPVSPIDATDEATRELRGAALREALTEEQYKQFMEWKRKTKEWHEEDRSRKSNVLDLSRTRKIAEKYAIYDNIYFVYSLDFRGRIYARASGLSPQGRDIQKGILRFSEEKELGSSGAYWFKIHGANRWAWDKLPFHERVSNVEEEGFTQMVCDIADDPITNRQWVAADKPWQFLAWCFEYAKFIEHCKTQQPETFCTFIACAQDGSCSGIQHYSAMLRDEVGGAAVNLLDSEAPNDIYGEVATVVHNRVLKDAMSDALYKGDLSVSALAEAWLAIGVTRGLCKNPVMTLPYGSSQMTCRESVHKYLVELGNKEEKNAKAEGRKVKAVHDWTDELWDAESYMSQHIWKSIGKVVIAARAGMKCIREIAKECAKRNKALIYTTPTGFIVKQEVYNTKPQVVNTVLVGRIQFWLYEETDQLSVAKMKSGSAPNIIHSLDASHLVMAICQMVDRGIRDFWIVHDDFGTHACQTEQLHSSLRETMVALYQDNILEDLHHQQVENMQCWFDVEIPEYGNLDLNEILKSKYVFC